MIIFALHYKSSSSSLLFFFKSPITIILKVFERLSLKAFIINVTQRLLHKKLVFIYNNSAV